jgi:hypothetical protein
MKQRENIPFSHCVQRNNAADLDANAAEKVRKKDTLTWNPRSLAVKG